MAVLVKGADWLVAGASAIAERAGVSSMVVGLTVVSFGTSMPELLVTFISAVENNADLAVANVIGSNVANVLLVLGLAAAVRPLPVRDATVVTEVPFSLAAALLVGFLANAALFSQSPELSISRLDGLILIFFFLLFLLYVYKVARETRAPDQARDPAAGVGKAWLLVLVGVLGLYVGGSLVVDSAVAIAMAWGVDDALVGLTIVAIGTSFPEVVASAVAAYRGEADLAVGNVVGSNVFNLLWVLGFTSIAVELPFEVINNTDLAMVIAASALLILALVSSRTRTVNRAHGVLFITLYLAYVVFAVQRG